MGARRHFGCTHRSPNFFHKMFWGLIVEPGKKYSQVVENSFHISKATAPQKKKKMEAEDKVVEAKEAEVAAPQTLSKNQKKKLAQQKKAESGDAPAPAKGQAQPNKNKDGKAQPNKKQNNAQKKN